MFSHQHRFSVLPLSNDSLCPQDHNRLGGQFSANYLYVNSRRLLELVYFPGLIYSYIFSNPSDFLAF